MPGIAGLARTVAMIEVGSLAIRWHAARPGAASWHRSPPDRHLWRLSGSKVAADRGSGRRTKALAGARHPRHAMTSRPVLDQSTTIGYAIPAYRGIVRAPTMGHQLTEGCLSSPAPTPGPFFAATLRATHYIRMWKVSRICSFRSRGRSGFTRAGGEAAPFIEITTAWKPRRATASGCFAGLATDAGFCRELLINHARSAP